MAITPGEAARLTGLGNHSGAGDQSQPAIWAYRKPSPGNATKTESNQGHKNWLSSIHKTVECCIGRAYGCLVKTLGKANETGSDLRPRIDR
jgi:hypothetical protein